jgi:hypothetical protein
MRRNEQWTDWVRAAKKLSAVHPAERTGLYRTGPGQRAASLRRAGHVRRPRAKVGDVIREASYEIEGEIERLMVIRSIGLCYVMLWCPFNTPAIAVGVGGGGFHGIRSVGVGAQPLKQQSGASA